MSKQTPRSLPASLNLDVLGSAVPRFHHYFRYPLHADDFHALRGDERMLGYYAAKPLYGRLDATGRVDRDAGFNGEIVTLFVPSPARSWNHARLVHDRMPVKQVRRANGKRNWPAIRTTAETAIRRSLQPVGRVLTRGFNSLVRTKAWRVKTHPTAHSLSTSTLLS